MPKPKVIFDAYAIDSLKSAIAKKLGFAIMNKADCFILSEAIKKSGQGFISPSTIFRLIFNIQGHVPYKNTLDIICAYLGYKSAGHYLEQLEPLRTFLTSSGIDVNKQCNSLLYYCLESNSKKPLHQFFDNLQEETDIFNWGVALSLYDDLLKTNHQSDFFKNFGGNRFVRTYLLEKLHDPTLRFSEYEAAYTYYLKYTPKKDDIHHVQDEIFGKAVLFRYYYLTDKRDKAVRLGKQIYKKGIRVETIAKEMYIFPLIRYVAYKVWYMEVLSYPMKDIYSYAMDLMQQAKQLMGRSNEDERDMILHTVAEVITYSGIRKQIEPAFRRLFTHELLFKSPHLKDKQLINILRYFDRNALIHNRP